MLFWGRGRAGNAWSGLTRQSCSLLRSRTVSQFIQVDAVYSMGHSSCKTPNKTKASPPQWGRGRGFVHRLFIYRSFLEKKVRRRKEERKRKVRCRAINTFGSDPGLVQSNPSAFPSYILLLSCSNKPCLVKTTNLLELSNDCFALICRVPTGAWSLYSWWELQMLAILPSQGLPPLCVWCQRSHWDLWQLLPVQSFCPN